MAETHRGQRQLAALWRESRASLREIFPTTRSQLRPPHSGSQLPLSTVRGWDSLTAQTKMMLPPPHTHQRLIHHPHQQIAPPALGLG